MFFVFAADDHHGAVTANDLALVTHGFDRRSDFHLIFLLGVLHSVNSFVLNDDLAVWALLNSLLGLVFVTPHDTTFGQIVRTDLDLYRVTLDNFDTLDTHFPRGICDDLLFAGLQLHPIALIGQYLNHFTLKLDDILFGHTYLPSLP
jgi:hypothetical protein